MNKKLYKPKKVFKKNVVMLYGGGIANENCNCCVW